MWVMAVSLIPGLIKRLHNRNLPCVRDHEEERGVTSSKLEPTEWVKMTVFVETRSKDRLKSGDIEDEHKIETLMAKVH